jgi:hypothetical protein
MMIDPADVSTPGTTTITRHQLAPNLTYHNHREVCVENWLIVGTGPTAEADWDQVLAWPADFLDRSELVLINCAPLPAGCTHANHHVTYHSEVFHLNDPMIQVLARRRHSNIAMPYTTDCWLVPDEYHVGGSAFLAAYIAGQLGVKRAILIGCPMEGGPEHTDLLQQVLDAPTHVWKYYRALVKSMSGATRDLFGAPTTL